MILGTMMMGLVLTVGAGPVDKDGDDEAARVRLEMHPEVLTAEMHRKSLMMSYPRRVALAAEKPAGVVKEPRYAGAPRYAAIAAGIGPRAEAVVAFDDDAEPPALYLDADRDGDLTNDPPVAWESIKTREDSTSLEVLLKVPATWSGSSGKATTGTYGVSLRKMRGAGTASLTRAGARTGTLALDGKTYSVALADNTADAVYDNAHAKRSRKPGVWLLVDLNGDKNFHTTADGREVLDTSRPFLLAGNWYTAEFPEDGSEVILRRSDTPPAAPAHPRRPLLGAGKTMPDFALVYADGRKGQFAETRGKIRVIDMWATWCGPCIAAMPRVEALYQKVKGQGVEVIGLDVMDEEANYKNWVATKKKDFHYTFARDASGKNHDATGIADKIGVDAIPTLFLIDQDDKVVLVVQGFGDENEARLESALRGLGIRVD